MSVLVAIDKRTQRRSDRRYVRPKITQARVYVDVCLKRPRSYYDYKNFKPQFRVQGDYAVTKKIGRGKYSEVFNAVQIHTGAECVIKVLKPVRKEKIKREISILQALSGGDNIITLLDMTRDPVTKTPCLVFEKINNIDFRKLYPTFTDLDIRHYMFQLLKALDYAHSNGIMHRDVKPHNVMIDHSTRTLKLIDWGLAEYYLPGQDYHVRVASLQYKGPELLIGIKDYDYSLDSWSLGCMFAGMIFKTYNTTRHFFPGRDRYDQLVKICKVLGTEGLLNYINKYDCYLTHHYQGLMRNFPRQPWTKFVTNVNRHLANDAALDLLDNLLVYDHQKRFTAAEAMAHPYFDPVRKMNSSKTQSKTSERSDRKQKVAEAESEERS